MCGVSAIPAPAHATHGPRSFSEFAPYSPLTCRSSCSFNPPYNHGRTPRGMRRNRHRPKELSGIRLCLRMTRQREENRPGTVTMSSALLTSCGAPPVGSTLDRLTPESTHCTCGAPETSFPGDLSCFIRIAPHTCAQASHAATVSSLSLRRSVSPQPDRGMSVEADRVSARRLRYPCQPIIPTPRRWDLHAVPARAPLHSTYTVVPDCPARHPELDRAAVCAALGSLPAYSKHGRAGVLPCGVATMSCGAISTELHVRLRTHGESQCVAFLCHTL
ncbi:hypothetical protein FKP32DRAFT_920220 [Trametes sanguinea]|nr:hypothetical protein FKP32DRAFT_920220 [Trametes sanguinea]